VTFVLDTHTLVWFLEDAPQLPKAIRAILKDRHHKLVIPSIILAELKFLAAKGKTAVSVAQVLAAMERDSRCVVYPLDG